MYPRRHHSLILHGRLRLHRFLRQANWLLTQVGVETGCKLTAPIDSPLCFRSSVCPSVTDYLGNRLMKFSEIWYVDAFQ